MSPLEYAKAYLVTRSQNLSQRMLKLSYDGMHRGGLSADSEDRAIEVENDEVLECIADATHVELAQVRHALDRIEQGVYGHCERCGHLIAEDRQRAHPEVVLCIDCARQVKQA